MRYLTLAEVLELHRLIMRQSGGLPGVRQLGLLEAALAQPRMTFDRADLYPSLEAKAAALCFFIVKNHPFVDGNKRCGHAALETFLVLNGKELKVSVPEAEQIILKLASGNLSLDNFLEWVKEHVVSLGPM